MLGVVDYIIFVIMLTLSATVGVYYRITGGQQKTTQEFLLADRNMNILPVGFSLMASFMSAITLLGVSAENYMYGTQFVMINIAYILGTPICVFVFLPVFYNLKAASAFEYLEHRFGRTTRILACLIFMLQMILYMGIVLYAPALAISAVTGLSKWSSIVPIGLVCTFYCTIGGMKAVLWTDVLQSLIMFAAMLAVIIKGTINVGGLANVWHIANDNGRIEFFNFDPDPTVRHTVWTLAIGGIFVYVSIYGVNQTQVQRLLTVKNLKMSQMALLLNWPITTLLSLITSLAGLVVYANVHDCDPLLRPEETNVKSPDQLLPYFVMTSFEHIPGLPGLFVAGIFSACLSTMSSAINSLVAVTFEDLLKPYCIRKLSQNGEALVTKCLAVLFGGLCFAVTYVVELLGAVLQASLTIFGVVGGPLLGLFSLGMLTTKANQKGVLIGFFVSLAICFWIGFGTVLSGVQPPKLPISDKGCPDNKTLSDLISSNTTESSIISSKNKTEKYVLPIYKLSYMWYAGLGWLITFVVGLISSIVIGGSNDVDLKLISPVVRRWYQTSRYNGYDQRNEFILMDHT